MKKLLAIILTLAFILSLAACGNTKSKEADLNLDSISDADKNEINEIVLEDETEDFSNLEISFEDVKSFDDFADKLDKSEYKPVLKQNDDGSIQVDMSSPTNDEDIKPAIPTTDKTKQPTNEETKQNPTPSITPQPETEPEPEPESKPELEENSEETKKEEPDPTPTPSPAKPEKEEEKKPVYTYTSNQKHTKIPYNKRYLYSLLDSEKKGWYRAIDESVTNLQPRAYINANLSENRNYYIYFLYMFDNPEHFYLGNTVTIYNHGNNEFSLDFCYSDGEMTCRYGSELKVINDELRARIKAKKAVFEAEANRILSTIPANAPNVWKEKLIYDRILIDSHYNLAAKWDGIAENNWTSYGILVNKMGVCESYSEAFQTLCLYAGINCTGVVGTAGGGHKWNCVELDGEWYMCDITFDDPIGSEKNAAYHYYFNRTSDWFIEDNHDWSNCDFEVPQCNGTKYDFENYFGDSRW